MSGGARGCQGRRMAALAAWQLRRLAAQGLSDVRELGICIGAGMFLGGGMRLMRLMGRKRGDRVVFSTCFCCCGEKTDMMMDLGSGQGLVWANYAIKTQIYPDNRPYMGVYFRRLDKSGA
ncbi:MAG: hypothetical protein PHP20_04185 [Firmicutes bacterium]|nr:hypothetical protein [Bacillota bacterium]MDD4336145.1 hypothetical protein [Bacillota bacterium]MDD4792242.1 hypothetical protein [Bacillota bacterium]